MTGPQRAMASADGSRTKCCNAPSINGLPPRGKPRCTGCGHRVPSASGKPPGQSRELPWWTWPGELIGRILARMADPEETSPSLCSAHQVPVPGCQLCAITMFGKPSAK